MKTFLNLKLSKLKASSVNMEESIFLQKFSSCWRVGKLQHIEH